MLRKYQNTIIRALTVFILLLLQLFFILMLPSWLQRNAVYVYFLIEVFSIILMFSLIADNTNSAYKIFWLGVVLLLPISGHVMYEFWGKEGGKKKQHRQIQDTIEFYKNKKSVDKELQNRIEDCGMQIAKISEYLCNDQFPAYENTKLQYFRIGEDAFDAMINDIKKAEKFIFLSFFTIADGILWDVFCKLLIEKANEGVEIKLMYDDAGSIFQLSDEAIGRMKRKNIEIRKFNAIEKNMHRQYFNYRNHQKIAVIDGNIAYTGGMNISDRYVNIDSPYGHWKDVAVRLYGEAVWGMTLIFLGMWDKKRQLENVEKYKPSVIVSSDGYIHPYADGPANNPENPARDMFHLMAHMANKELFIMTPYLILDEETNDCLCIAAKSGVTIKIITPGIPDKKRTKLLTEWHYGALLEAGVHIYEYTPGFVHAKVCMNDNSCFVGTVNMDYRSFYLHYECGVWFADSAAWEAVYCDFQDTLDKCREVTLDEWRNRPVIVKGKQLFLQSFKSQF